MDQDSGQVVDPELAVGGAGRSAVAQEAMADKRKSAAYTVVCKHFEPTSIKRLVVQSEYLLEEALCLSSSTSLYGILRSPLPNPICISGFNAP